METTCIVAVLSALIFGLLMGVFEKEIAYSFSKGKLKKTLTPSLWWDTFVVGLAVITFISMLCVSSYDSLRTLNFELSFGSILVTFVTTLVLCRTLTLIGYGIIHPKEALAKDYFRTEFPSICIKIINLTILGVWLGLIYLFCICDFTINVPILGICLLVTLAAVALIAFVGGILFILIYGGYLLIKALYNHLKK